MCAAAVTPSLAPDAAVGREGRYGRSLAFAAALALGGCAAVGPNFTPPTPPAAKGYAGAADGTWPTASLTADTRASGPWWRDFDSPALDEVMTRALANNQNLAVAQATLEKLRAESEREAGGLRPQVSGVASYQRERIDTAAFGFAGFPSPTLNFFNVGPSVSYDLDLAGGRRRRVESARARAQAQARRADAAYLALTGNVALAAVKIAALRAYIDTLNGVVEDDHQSIEIVSRAEAAGGAPPSARLGGKLQLEQDQALLPPLLQSLAEQRHALALLVGEAPSEWSPPNFAVEDFKPPGSVPVAIPSVLVKSRPDIQAAEADLHADTAMVGVETARLYPDVQLVASTSQEGVTPGSLFGLGASAYSFGPQATVPIFDGGAIRADRRAAQAQVRASLAQYRQTVVKAFTQVSDVLSALAQDDDRLATLGRAETTARASLEDAQSAYRLGGAPLSMVVGADRTWRRASLARVDAVGQRMQDIVALYGATATNWQAPPNLTGMSPLPGKTRQDNTAITLAPPARSP
jgi:NodT family efflux transporter outer membrane factor (OMF) lipoprotein